MDQGCAKILKTHFASAAKALSKDCRFVVCTEDESEDKLADKIRNERGFDMASASEETMVHYGVALSGQASSAACYNPVSFRKAHFDKHIRGALHSSVQPGAKALKIPSTWTFLIQDAGKSGNHAQMLTAFTSNNGKSKMLLSAKKLDIIFSQKSVQDRYQRVKGFHNAFEKQTCLVVTESALDLEVRNRMFHEGDNRSCNLYPVKLDSYKQPCVWKASAAVKAQVFGPSNIVGNPSANYIPVEAAEGEESYIDKFGDEPIFFHNTPVKLAREFLHCYKPQKKVIDLTGADGPFLLACAKERLACLAVCHTQTHADLLEQFCVHQLFRDMQDPDDPKYSSQLVAAINGHFEMVTKKEEEKGGALKDVGANADKEGKSTDPKGKKPREAQPGKSKKEGKSKKGMLKKKKKKKKGMKEAKQKSEEEADSDDDSDDDTWGGDDSEPSEEKAS